MKILLTGAEGDIADAVCRILREEVPDSEVHGSDLTGDDWLVRAGYSVVHQLPRGDAPAYPDAIRALHLSEKFDWIVPLTGAELRRLSASDQQLPLLMVRADLVRVFLDKLATVEWLLGHGVAAPKTVPLADAAAEDLPLLLKPRLGHGSRGIVIVRAERQLEQAKGEAAEEMVAQEFLPDADAEFTCGIYRHAASGEIRTITFRRRLAGGLTGRATVEEDPEITRALRRLAEAADLDGSINAQLRTGPGGPKIFEINPRFSSTVMMRHRLGFKDVIWSLAGRAGIAPPAFIPPVGMRVFRLSRELVVPSP